MSQTMDEMEFMRVVQAAYDREIARGRPKDQARRTAEKFRSALIVSLAREAYEAGETS
jgi:hypothetical protein